MNNAGLIRREDALEFSEKDWDDVMNLNIKSVFFMSQAAWRNTSSRKAMAARLSISRQCSPSVADPCAFLYRIKKRRDGRDAIDGE